ncbi:MAG: hypothetical protein MR971_10115 [Bacteroidales bacterium]|nr:hypothetical protein [Bacteroidales bacterium]
MLTDKSSKTPITIVTSASEATKTVRLRPEARKNEKPAAFLFHCTRLALTFHNLGGGSARKNEKPAAFLFHCTRLALTLSPKDII